MVRSLDPHRGFAAGPYGGLPSPRPLEFCSPEIIPGYATDRYSYLYSAYKSKESLGGLVDTPNFTAIGSASCVAAWTPKL